MKLKSFRVTKYKGIMDSGSIELEDLTVIVGKNESGKTSLLRALHKFNPFNPDPYRMEREWPRGHRREQNDRQIICEARFQLTDEELDQLKAISDQPLSSQHVIVTKDYAGRFEVLFENGIFPDKIHPSEIEAACTALPCSPTNTVGPDFVEAAASCRAEAVQLAREGRFSDLAVVGQKHPAVLQAAKAQGNPEPQHTNETNFIAAYTNKVAEIAKALAASGTMQKKAHEFVVKHLPVFIYMDEYRAFQGTAFLDQVKQRVDSKSPTEEDKSLLMILKLSGLSLDAEVKKAQSADREQRQYDLDDAGASLTNDIEGRWGQSKYVVQFRADGQQFFTMVEDETKSGLIRLEERSKGFQWFFSFDLMFMHESAGTFEGCVILLDEPGLHLHPEAQRDLLRRLEAYSEKNTLIYTTHLPFMLDLRKPERIRVISESPTGAMISEDLSDSPPDAKLTLQAALGMNGSTSYLLAQRNLVVEGVSDFWLITELSNLFVRSGKQGLPDDVYVTAAGGASEAAYITALMIGQELDVVTLLDSDAAGIDAAGKLVKKWLTRYKNSNAEVVMLGDAIGQPGADIEIEDLFPEDYYCKRVWELNDKRLMMAGLESLKLAGADGLAHRVERAFEAVSLKFNKSSVAKRIRTEIAKMKAISELPTGTASKAEALFSTLQKAFK